MSSISRPEEVIFSQAVEALAQLEILDNPQLRIRYATQFRDITAYVRRNRARFLAFLRDRLPNYGYAATRLLVACGDFEWLSEFCKPFVQYYRPLSAQVTVEVWKQTLSKAELVEICRKGNSNEHINALKALLSKPSIEGSAYFNYLTDHNLLTYDARALVASWGGSELLEYAAGRDDLEAMFFLALYGDKRFEQKLKDLALSSKSTYRLSKLCTYLTWLSQPEVIEALLKVLRYGNRDDVGLALGSVMHIGLGLFGDELLRLLDEYIQREEEEDLELRDSIIYSLEFIFGEREYADQSLVSMSVGTYRTRENAATVLDAFRGTMHSLDPMKRYRNGRPFSLTYLADDLLSRHRGPRDYAIYSLWSVFKDSLGYDLTGDIHDNISSILLWRERVASTGSSAFDGWMLK